MEWTIFDGSKMCPTATMRAVGYNIWLPLRIGTRIMILTAYIVVLAVPTLADLK